MCLNYGSFICAPASKTVLFVINPIHSSATHLCTGAFRMSRVESLYAESGDPVPATCRQILLCGCATNLSSLKKPYFYRSMHQHSLQGWSAFKSKASHLQALDKSSSWMHFILPHLPSSLSKCPQYCTDHTGSYSDPTATPPDTFCSHTVQRAHSRLYRWVSDQWIYKVCTYLKCSGL
jgi:hypothetical protein